MPRPPIPTWFAVVVAVHHQEKFLIVQENKLNFPWYLPAGRVEPGENYIQAAHREVLEEGGIEVVLEGILRVEWTPHRSGTAFVRIILAARPNGSRIPKSIPDEESLRAAWVTLEELKRYTLRAPDALAICSALAGGAEIFPLELVAPEGSPFIFPPSSDQK